MSLTTPLIWVILPIMIALVCAALFKRPILSVMIASMTAFGLAALAAFFPETLTINVGPLTLTFEESLGILGRQLTIAYAMLPFIALIYGMSGLWALSSNLPGVPITFRPISLVMTALLTAAMGVQPFLYAALLIETAVLISIPLLSPAGDESDRGILRYLTLMTIAMPFILMAGWLLTGVFTLPADSPLVGQTALMLGLGFALWLGVFPFHSWVPMVSHRSHPVVVSYLLFILPTVILLFGLNFLNRYAFLRTSAGFMGTIRIIGAVMILFGGVWTAVQTHLKRAFGFSTLVETGFSLLAVGFFAEGGLNWLVLLFPVRALGYWLWSYTLTRIEQHCGLLDISAIQGFARQFPILSAGLLLAQLSIAGLPLLASFPFKSVLLTQAFSAGTGLGLWSFIGNLGLFLFSMRVLLFLIMPPEIEADRFWHWVERRSEYLPVVIMVLLLVVFGLFPGTFLSGLISILTAFPQLQ
jgi:NADH-quinone oxidoreductase subunit N